MTQAIGPTSSPEKLTISAERWPSGRFTSRAEAEPLVESGETEAHAHVVRFLESGEQFVPVAAQFIAAALRAGAPALAITTPEHLDGIRSRLAADPSLEGALEGDQLAWLDVRETLAALCSDGKLDSEACRLQLMPRFTSMSARHPRARLRVVGEGVTLLWNEGHGAAAIELERLWNELACELPMTILCTYGLEQIADAEHGHAFAQICRAHTAVVPREAAGSAAEAERRHLEATVEDLRQQLAQATRAKDEFLAMLGHELRNPLAPISTALQLLRLRGTESRELKVIERQIEHLVRLVDDLLDVSRITRGKIQVHKKPTELAEIVARAIETTSPLLEQRRHRLELDVPRAGLVGDLDADRMTQVVANLLTNAAKYSEPGSQITVRATRAGNRLRLAVRDEGIGIAPELLGPIFDLFVQQPQALDRARGGLGLGLVIVRSLVELHGGSVSATSDGPGTGSEFVIELPAAPQQKRAAQAAAAEQLPALAGAPKRRVLVVDDNEDAAQLLADLLDTLGYEVAVANDGPSALEVVETFRPEIGLLDIGLPVMDGYELARQLRARFGSPRKLQLAAVTGYGQEGDRRRSEEAGFTRHLVKPVSLDALVAVVEQLSDSLDDPEDGA
jgi:signal transduction histidine kinase/ActR/RegA family two-component response regulator